MALILIDVINDLASPDITEDFVERCVAAAARVADLKRRAKAAGVPAIYANDNFGQWRSDFAGVIRHCTSRDGPGKALSQRLLPEDDDYFVLKPRHSGFYGTSLQLLLQELDKDTLILTGFAGDVCVLFTAHDAYMRQYGLFVPCDGIASVEPAGKERALALMAQITKADIRPTAELDFGGGEPAKESA